MRPIGRCGALWREDLPRRPPYTGITKSNARGAISVRENRISNSHRTEIFVHQKNPNLKFKNRHPPSEHRENECALGGVILSN